MNSRDGQVKWCDAGTPEGVHTGAYTDKERAQFLEYLRASLKTVDDKVIVPNDGAERILHVNCASMAYVPNLTQGFITKDIAPQYFVCESVGVADGWYYAMIIVWDEDVEDLLAFNIPQLNGYKAALVTGNLGGYAYHNRYYRTSAGNITAESLLQGCNDLHDASMKWVMVWRPTGFLAQFFDCTGEFRGTWPFKATADIKDYVKAHRIGFGWYDSVSNAYHKSFGVFQYAEFDYVGEAACGVTTDVPPEQIVGAPDAKTAITDTAESSYVELASGEEIVIDLPGAAHDVPVFETSVVCNSTDANPLDVGFRIDGMDTAWTETIQLGDTAAKRCCNEKIDPANTYYKKTILYPDILRVLKLAQNSMCAVRSIWLKNKSASSIRIYKVITLKSLCEAVHLDSESRLADSYSIVGADVPTGVPGTAKTLSFKNNSVSIFTTVEICVAESGEPGVDDIFQFSVDGGTTWYDVSDGWKTLASGLAAGAHADYKVRSNMPNTGNVFYNHKARMEFRITV